MKKRLWISIITLSVFLMTSCGNDKAETKSNLPEKIEFPKVNYTVSPSNDTTIFGPQGTRIFIGSNTFQYIDGSPVNDSITIEIKEFFSKADIVLADISTVSDDKLLETGGMLNISATSYGKKLKIKEDKRIVVHFPKEPNSYKRMDLFFADQSATDTSVTNWKVDTISLVKETIQILSLGYYWYNSSDSTEVDSKPKNFVDTGYYYNPLELYVNRFNFSKEAIKEINDYSADYYVGVEFDITEQGKVENPIVRSKISKNVKTELLSFVNGLPELTPSKDKYGNIVKRRAILGLSKGKIIPLYKTDEEYIQSFNSKYIKYENEPIRNMNDAELNYYVFSVSKLGWINCDRFIDADETVDLFPQLPVDSDTKLKMVFSDIDGVLMANIVDDKYVFKKVPKGRKVTIIGIKNKNGQFLTAFKEFTITDKPIDDLTFTETTLAELRTKIEKM